ncbi:MAG: ornithine carbamoyltransferase, partial [Acidimicrobiia bacterium]|nr:ornithine carbamoyltransferase [Acidimicrobiia bacterium]
MSVRHFLEITDLTARDLNAVLTLAQAEISKLGRPLADKGVALIFEKPSNRTRHSMEMAVVQLGGHPIFTRGEEVGFDERETVEDVTRIMAGYHHVIAARVFAHSVLQRMAKVSSVPIINMLSEQSHPLQAIADVLTMRQELGDLAKKTVAWIGDYNNVARSLLEACALEGMHVRMGCPKGYGADDNELNRISKLGAASVEQHSSA